MKLNTQLLECVTSKYATRARSINGQELAAALAWYKEAQEFAQHLTTLTPWSLEVAASVVSSFSPRNKWATNKAHALLFAMGGKPKGLRNNLRMAQASTRLGFNALNGQKTNAFARAISGDMTAVVIDTWMIRAAGLDSSKGVNKTQYATLAAAVCRVAYGMKWDNAQAQAAIWCAIRGGHA
jgi:hypothetical protein